MQRITKYRTNVNRILLVIYFLSLLAGTIHHHHFDFTDIKSVATQTTSNNQNLLLISDTGSTCIILQNLVNLQTALVIGFNANQLIKDEHPVLNISKIFFSTNKLHLTDNLRRGPPSLS